MAMSIKEMDQTNWVCYRFNENTYYYGEVGLLDKSGVVHSKDNVQMATQSKLVKHGFGIYIYDDPTGNCRYEGYFHKGCKSGKGKVTLKDGTIYEGVFKDDQYHDNGIMKFGNGDMYDGRWKKSRMDGPGLFKRKDGFTLKGSFKNNYFIDGNVLRNPFMNDEQYELLKKKRKQIHKQYQKNEKAKNGYFERVEFSQEDRFMGLLDKSWKNNRVPLVIASEQANKSIDDVISLIEKNGKQSKIIDVRRHFKLSGEEQYNYRKEITQNVQVAMKEGHLLILSLDDSPQVQEFKQIFYPEIKQLYEPQGLNQLIWSPRDLRKPNISEKIIGKQEKVHENFGFFVWSKVKISQEGITDDFIREKVQKRFQSVLEFIKIDIVYFFANNEQPQNNENKGE